MYTNGEAYVRISNEIEYKNIKENINIVMSIIYNSLYNSYLLSVLNCRFWNCEKCSLFCFTKTTRNMNLSKNNSQCMTDHLVWQNACSAVKNRYRLEGKRPWQCSIYKIFGNFCALMTACLYFSLSWTKTFICEPGVNNTIK